MSKPKKNAKKRNRNQGKIQRYIYRKQHKEKEFKKKNEKKNANMVSIKSIQHLRQKVADTVLDKRKTCKQTKKRISKTINVKR